jgi:glycosyltransferase involved in cell wall biosynthesis
MNKKKSVLIVFPDEWLQYSPSLLNLYNCCKEEYYTKIIYINHKKFDNTGLVDNYKSIRVRKFPAYVWRKTFGYKLYKVFKLFWCLFLVKLFDRRYDIVIAIDSSGYVPTKLFFPKTIFFSLELKKDNFYKISRKLGIDRLIIQSKERKDFLVGENPDIEVFYIQNAPILKKQGITLKEKTDKRILFLGNIDFGYAIDQFIDCIKELDDSYTLTLKGIRNENFFNLLNQKYADLIHSGKLIFDFNYTEQSKIIEYVSQFYIGIVGYDLEVVKHDFNQFSAPSGKLFNYYAAGIPVMATDIIGLRSVKDYNAGVLIDTFSADKIKDAVNVIEKNYQQFSANCLVAAEAFDFKKAFDAFIKAVDK